MSKKNQSKKNRRDKKYVIGVDGGGTKTVAALADLNGKILSIAKSGSSNPRNVGIKISAENIAKAINKVLPRTFSHQKVRGKKKAKILAVFIGLPALEEEYRDKKEKIKKEISKRISKGLGNKIKIDSDQLIAFRSGTDEKNGIMIIAGTGCVAHGWRGRKEAKRGRKEAKAGGWGWVSDEGSGFWIGQKVCQNILKELDARGPKTLLTKIAFQKLKIRSPEGLLKRIYSKDQIESISAFSIFSDEAAKKGDKIAKKIMTEAGKEISLAANTVIKKLNLQKEKFPVVLVGSMFKSTLFLKTVKASIKKIAPKAIFIRPQKTPVTGALKLAIEQIKKC